MTKSSWIVFAIMAGVIVILSFILYRVANKKDQVITIPGDTTYHEPAVHTPTQVGVSIPVAQTYKPKPIIIYLPDPNGNVVIDTNAIRERYESVIHALDSVISELLTVRYYSDTINDTSAKVRAVIKDQVTNNRIQPGRTVAFMNMRPISIRMNPPDRKGAFLWGVNVGYNFIGDPLFGLNMDYITAKDKLFGITVGTGFLVPGNRFVLLRYSQKL